MQSKTPFSTEASRVEAFSDGVIAVIITIMVLELKPPHGTDLGSLHEIVPTLLAYILSFVYVGIYWNNHHHMLRATSGVDGRAMWANLHLLFWLSLVPFTTAWLGAHPVDAVPNAVYAIVLMMDAIAYTLLQTALVAVNGKDGDFAKAVSLDLKGKISLALTVVAIGCAFVSPAISQIALVVSAIAWIVPDRRFEPIIMKRGDG